MHFWRLLAFSKFKIFRERRIARGWDGVLARFQEELSRRGAMGQLDFSSLEFIFLGNDAAWCWTLHLARAKGDIRGSFFPWCGTFSGSWRIVTIIPHSGQAVDGPGATWLGATE